MADINYAVRWLKTQAAALGGRADRVGIMGTSSGGQQAMLAAMRPRDTRYAAIPLPAGSPAVDATVQAAILCWPVIDPLGRYRYAKALKTSGKLQAVHGRVRERSSRFTADRYWADEMRAIQEAVLDGYIGAEVIGLS